MGFEGLFANTGLSVEPFMQILLVVCSFSILPALLMLASSFTRIYIVLHFLKQGFQINGLPNNQMILGLSVVLSAVVMAPVYKSLSQKVLNPSLEKKISPKEAFTAGEEIFVSFMWKHVKEQDRVALYQISNVKEERSIWNVLPAFALSEIKTGFLMGALVFLPFVLIDLVVSVLLTAVGFASVNATSITIPLKVLLFVWIDGWSLLFGEVIKSFQA